MTHALRYSYVKPHQLAFYLTCTAEVLESQRRDTGLTNARIREAGEMLKSAPHFVQQLAREVWKQTEGDKARTAKAVLDALE